MTQLQGSGGVLDEAREAADRKIWVTLTGLPLRIRLEWPFRRAASGADFWVLHGDIGLVGSEGLHAPVAVNLSQTVREVMASLEPEDAEAPVVNALRKEVDRRQIEFLKSGKLVPVAFSSRHYDFKRKQWVFGRATDEEIAEFIERKVYWETKLGSGETRKSNSPPSPTEREKGGATGNPREIPRPAGGGAGLGDDAGGGRRVWIADRADAQYLGTTAAHLLEVGARLVAAEGLARIEGEWAEATQGLMNQGEQYEREGRRAVEELEKKHAFERG
jgi:hypothetical protein